jgi:hypothetical protein
MARTTATRVEGIIEVDPDDTLTPFINSANRVVTRICEDTDDAYTTDELEDIECWLAAHFYAVLRPAFVVESVDVMTTRIESKVDLGLSNTRWGIAAMAIDTFGNLANWNNEMVNRKPTDGRRTPSLSWLGIDQSPNNVP